MAFSKLGHTCSLNTSPQTSTQLHSFSGSQTAQNNNTGRGTLAILFTPLCQCLSEETLKVVGPFYLVAMPGEVKDHTKGFCTNFTIETLEFEEYLINLDFKYMKNLCKFICGSHHLPVNNSRFILNYRSYAGRLEKYFVQRTKFLGNRMILNLVTYKHLLKRKYPSLLV